MNDTFWFCVVAIAFMANAITIACVIINLSHITVLIQQSLDICFESKKLLQAVKSLKNNNFYLITEKRNENQKDCPDSSDKIGD